MPNKVILYKSATQVKPNSSNADWPKK